MFGAIREPEQKTAQDFRTPQSVSQYKSAAVKGYADTGVSLPDTINRRTLWAVENGDTIKNEIRAAQMYLIGYMQTSARA